LKPSLLNQYSKKPARIRLLFQAARHQIRRITAETPAFHVTSKLREKN